MSYLFLVLLSSLELTFVCIFVVAEDVLVVGGVAVTQMSVVFICVILEDADCTAGLFVPVDSVLMSHGVITEYA